MRTSSLSQSIRGAGFTLVEVMIALLIGIIGIVVMMQTFAVSEGFKRTATSGTDAQINGGVALYMLEREIRLGGFGLGDLQKMGCTSVRVWYNPTGTGTDISFFPFMINPAAVPAGDANTDVLLLTYGTSDSFVSGVQADQRVPAPPSPTNVFTLISNWDAFKTGDLFITVQPGSPTYPATSCVMHEATGTNPASGNCGVTPAAANQLSHGTANYKSARNGCVLTTPTHNSSTGIKDAAGVVVPYLDLSKGGQIFNLGAPSIRVYAIRGGNLTFCDWVVSDCTVAANFTIMVNDIVSLRAVYGMNLTPTVTCAVGDGVVVPSRASITTDPCLPGRVSSVTLEIVARSSLKEKPSAGAGNVCDTTPVKSRPDRSQDWLFQTGPNAAPIDLSTVSADWSCYRYKLFQTTVPVRNLIWRP
jgi:type IV pilus assembly protein PilW